MTDVLLTIAGTDPSGAAGIQVDLQVFRDYGFHGVSAITSVLWQNTVGVRGMRALQPDEVVAQIRAVTDDVSLAGVKIGLVPDAGVVDAILESLPEENIPIVWDPVLSSGDGAVELTAPGTAAALARAMAFVDVFTPNVPEAEILLGIRIATREDARDAARELVARDALGVLLKVGHLPDEDGQLRDVWADATGARDLAPLPAVDVDVRGTGCQLSSAILAELAHGASTLDAVEAARAYLSRLLHDKSEEIGRGRPVIIRK